MTFWYFYMTSMFSCGYMELYINDQRMYRANSRYFNQKTLTFNPTSSTSYITMVLYNKFSYWCPYRSDYGVSLEMFYKPTGIDLEKL